MNPFEQINFMGITGSSTHLDRARFVVLPVPYEQTTSYKKGTRFGPQALINASCQVELFDEELWQETWKQGIHTLPPFPYDPDPVKFHAALSEYAGRYIDMKKVLFIIGGEHSISAAPVKAYAKRFPKLSIFHIDAHADMRESFEESRYNHACAARRMIEFAPIVQVGIRSISEDEYSMLNTKRVRTFFMHEHLEKPTEIIPDVLDALSDDVYITIDLDGLDPSIIPGVGTPVPGGLSWYHALDFLRAVIRNKNVVGVDVVELCPLDDTVISEFAAARLVYRMMGYASMKKPEDRKQNPGGEGKAVAKSLPKKAVRRATKSVRKS